MNNLKRPYDDDGEQLNSKKIKKNTMFHKIARIRVKVNELELKINELKIEIKKNETINNCLECDVKFYKKLLVYICVFFSIIIPYYL